VHTRARVIQKRGLGGWAVPAGWLARGAGATLSAEMNPLLH